MTVTELRKAEEARLERRRSLSGGLYTVARTWGRLDYSQLAGAGRQLRVLAAGNGATAADIGKFWFVAGYSVIGGPDVLPAS